MTLPASARLSIAAVLSAVLVTLALPDFGWWPLAFVAWTPLLRVLPDARPRDAFLASWATGTLAHLGIFPWIVHTAVTMSDFPMPAAIAVLAVFAVAHGVAWGVVGWFVRVAAGAGSAGFVATAAVAVAAGEHLAPQLFPWHLGSVFWRTPVLLQGVDVTGMAGATFVAVAFGAALAVALRDRATIGRVRAAGPLLAVALLAAWIGYGLVRLPQVRQAVREAPTVRLALVQPDITALEKRTRDHAFRVSLVDRLFEVTRSADLAGVEAVIWPEGSFPYAFVPAPDASVRERARPVAGLSRSVLERVRELGLPVILGSVTRDERDRGHNSAVLIGPEGAVRMRYDKRRLLAFGEYMPLSDRFPSLKGRVRGVGDLTPGERPVEFPIGDARAAASICYEAIQSAFTRDAVVGTGADLIVNLTNDGWFGDYGAPAQHLMIQVPRAVELRMPLVRVTQTGITAVVTAAGDFLAETALHERRTLVVDVPRMAASGPYARIGPVFAWACVGGVALAAAAAWRRHRIGKKSRSTTTG